MILYIYIYIWYVCHTISMGCPSVARNPLLTISSPAPSFELPHEFLTRPRPVPGRPRGYLQSFSYLYLDELCTICALFMHSRQTDRDRQTILLIYICWYTIYMSDYIYIYSHTIRYMIYTWWYIYIWYIYDIYIILYISYISRSGNTLHYTYLQRYRIIPDNLDNARKNLLLSRLTRTYVVNVSY